MHIARFSRRLRRCSNLHVCGAALDRFAVRRCRRVITFVRGHQPGPRANLNLLEICRLLNFSWRITLRGGVHDVHPDRQCELASKGAAINLLRLVKARPHSAGEIGIVSGKQRIGKIVSSAGLTRRWHFLQTKICKSSFACS